MRCPKCHFDNRAGAKFCNECGHALQAPNKEKPPIAYDRPQSYTPRHLADKILTTRASIEGERKIVTVLFGDVANSTAIFERLDPEDVHQVMDGCFRILMDEIHRHEGTVNQFRGDCVMALFGAPLAHEDHARRACLAALSIQDAMKGYGEKIKARFGIEFKMRIGLNSGLVFVGSIGNDLRMDYSADGDAVNLASRMESLAEPDTVLVSKNTYKLAQNYFDFESLGKVRVKGKTVPQEAYVLLKPSNIGTRIAASAARGLTRFVGRERELETIKQAFDKAGSGQGQVVKIVGEAGIGKSRLLLELQSALPQGEYTYLEGHCLHYGGSMPYLPILDVFRSFMGINEGERESVIKKKMNEKILGLDENLKSVISPMQELLSLKVEDEEYVGLDPKLKREKTFAAIKDLLVMGSQETPLVLAIEDLHWIDKTSEEFLDYMIEWLPDTRNLLILLYRPEYTHAWEKVPYCGNISLDRLHSDDSTELVRAILHGEDVTPELRDLILGRASGNPFFLEELTLNLLENGSILKKENRYVLSSTPSNIQVPDTIQGIIASRMDRLEEALKRIMQEASVIGRDFSFRILHAVSEMKEDLKNNLQNLQGFEFIDEKSFLPELEYIFRHAFSQEVAYGSLLLKRRKELHEKIGMAMEELYSDRLEEFCEILAYHYSRSENGFKACQYLKLSGDKAKGNFSSSEAFRFYKDAVNLLHDQPEEMIDNLFRLEILHAMVRPMAVLGFPEGSIEFLEEGERLAQGLGDQEGLTYFQRNMGIYYLVSVGNPAKGKAYMEKGLENFDPTEESKTAVPETMDLIASQVFGGEFFKICRIAPNLINLIEKTNTQHESFSQPQNIYSMLNGWYGMGLGATGHFAAGAQFLEKGLRFARDINNVYSMTIIEMAYGSFYYYKGDAENQLKYYSSILEDPVKSQFALFKGVVLAWLGRGYHYLGQDDSALGYVEKGLKIHSDFGMSFYLGSMHNTLSLVHMNLGNLEKALVHARQAVDLSQSNNEKHFEAESKIVLGCVTVAMDRNKFDEARELVHEGMRMFHDLQIRSRYAVALLSLGELYANAGQRDVAVENMKKAEGMFLEMGMDYWSEKAREILGAV